MHDTTWLAVGVIILLLTLQLYKLQKQKKKLVKVSVYSYYQLEKFQRELRSNMQDQTASTNMDETQQFFSAEADRQAAYLASLRADIMKLDKHAFEKYPRSFFGMEQINSHED